MPQTLESKAFSAVGARAKDRIAGVARPGRETGMTSKSKTVLMLSPHMGEMLPRIRSGVLRVAQERRWDFYPVTCLYKADGSMFFERSPGGETLEELLALLGPDGVIVALDVVTPASLRAAARAAGLGGRLKCVHLGEPESTAFPVYAHGDAKGFAELALRQLLKFGFENYAFAPDPRGLPWSRARGEAFTRLVALAGRRLAGLDAVPSKDEGRALTERYLPWLAALPLPCGVFAANDIVGEAMLLAARRLGIGVPDELAVVGVDDNAAICDNTHPMLSSVRRDLEGEGRAAAELLAEWMARSFDRPPRPRAVPPVSLTVRLSTRLSWQRDRRVAHAEEWIRVHACEEGVGPRDVVRQMGVSRTQADRLFRTVAERSILGEIQAVRIERAKERLRAGVAPDLVAAECGFGSTLDFRRVFRKVVGVPVVKWTKTV